MKTLLYTLAMVTLLALPILAEEAKPVANPVEFSGRMAVGFENSPMTPSDWTAPSVTHFSVPDAKLKADVKVDPDITATIRMNFDNGENNGVDFAYLKLDNSLKKLGSPDAFNPEITVGKFKVNFGEETWSNNPIENALLSNSVANVTGNDVGLQLKQKLNIEMPVLVGISLAFLNGNGAAETSSSKAYALKIDGQMKNGLPLSFSLSSYNSGRTDASVLEVMGSDGALMNQLHGWNRGIFELDVRYDLDAKNFDPSKAPLFADAKGVFRLAYGQGTDKATVGGDKNEYTYIILDGIYNVNEKWFAAFRYSTYDSKFNGGDSQTWSRISLGGGYKLGDNTALKLEYSQNTEPDTTANPKNDNNDTVKIMLTTKW